MYIASFMSSDIIEKDLELIFDALYSHCLVLLEDINSVGLTCDTFFDSKALDKKTGISLSVFLNVIDGVASQEGRVLIMTTNKPKGWMKPGT
ncbi:hypothetical protein BofuT4_uP031410.1 [Botrytis cinerea T4]|uniref:ATPase AAA-type core domain-containing protein n=1 Tax=Botryotinia fuckeliana (strain T4) TaxID=999810 RepID=G2Y9I9_BOTF4|nr:hypothetical protein BofuT4_uP031410.1 [Botrytis cinerea T4]